MLNHRLEKPVEAYAKLHIQKDMGSLEEKLVGKNLETSGVNKKLRILYFNKKKIILVKWRLFHIIFRKWLSVLELP